MKYKLYGKILKYRYTIDSLSFNYLDEKIYRLIHSCKYMNKNGIVSKIQRSNNIINNLNNKDIDIYIKNIQKYYEWVEYDSFEIKEYITTNKINGYKIEDSNYDKKNNYIEYYLDNIVKSEERYNNENYLKCFNNIKNKIEGDIHYLQEYKKQLEKILENNNKEEIMCSEVYKMFDYE